LFYRILENDQRRDIVPMQELVARKLTMDISGRPKGDGLIKPFSISNKMALRAYKKALAFPGGGEELGPKDPSSNSELPTQPEAVRSKPY
jgi:hypothetical protein